MMGNDPVSSNNRIVSLTFNQDFRYFVCAGSCGFAVYNADEAKKIFERRFDNIEICHVEMLFGSNIFIMVCRDRDFIKPPNIVLIWDDNMKKIIKSKKFRSAVTGIRRKKNFLVVILEKKIYLHDFNKDMKIIQRLETFRNPSGLCGISQKDNGFVLAYPALQEGYIRVKDLHKRTTQLIKAHRSAICCISMSLDGTLIATASVKGHIVRVFSMVEGLDIWQLRRGTDHAKIYDIGFSHDNKWLCVSCDKGKVHLFGLGRHNSSSYAIDGASPFSLIKDVFPGNFRHFAVFEMKETCPCFVGFGMELGVVIFVTLDGSCYKCRFDHEKGGQMKILDYARICW